MIPIRYQYPAENKILGCLMYIIIVPILSLCITLFSFVPIFCLIQWAGLPEEACTGIGLLILCPLVIFFVGRFAVRDFRRRAGMEVIIDHDRIELTFGGKYRAISHEDIRSVRLVRARGDMVCVLKLASHEQIRLPEEVSSYMYVREPLEATLIRHLADRMPSRLEQEEAIRLHESRLAGLMLIVRGAIWVVPGIALSLGIFGPGGREFLRSACQLIGQGRLARRGGFAVCLDGVLPRRSPAARTIPWSEVVIARRDDCGILLQAADGTMMSASSLARDWWPVARWMEGLCAETITLPQS